MMILTIEIVQLYLNEFEMLETHLLKRTQVKDEKDIQKKLKEYLNQYDSFEPLDEQYKNNDVKQAFLVKNGNKYMHIGYSVTGYEI
ncbi:hypothetical protein P3U41_05640 [Mammaliicoccus sciuri]|uniref:hypothetical protein n=1 Tax=Mammaliicoccus sciuri TaxID=1296 RepID=UPI002B25690B|nr:hypothetical protein [Mammaliicoccus sciuri]WQL34251.1 hypothetical protein P3U41_05640 [Mammaliicoccus sciuri]WQL61190.1 hypothetical protein P3T96_05640 [Mammaliicoccus sciuri]